MNGDFENTIKNLSYRAKRVLFDLGVIDVDSILKITRDQLERVRGYSKKTISEIEALRKSLSDSIKTSQVLNTLAKYENIPPDAFEALLGILSKRSRNILESLGTNDLKTFLMVNRDQLLRCRHCGQKTVNEILNIQSGIKIFIRDQINQKGFLQPEELINAPCLAGISVSDHKGDTGDNQKLYADCNNPSPWLSVWINELSRSKKKAQAFMLQKGMVGSPPITLEATGEKIGGVTKERVRQIIGTIEEAATRQQYRLKPLIDAALDIVKRNGGIVGLDELTKMLLCKGEDGEQLKHATGLVKFFPGLKIWIDHNLEIQNNVVLQKETSSFFIRHFTNTIEDIASTYADEKTDDRLWSIDIDLLKDSLIKELPTTNESQTINTISDALIDTILEKLQNKLKRYKGRVYSSMLWKLRFGNATQVLDAALNLIGKPADYNEVYEYALKWRPDILNRNAYAILNQSNDALLWNSCVFMHKENVDVSPDLIRNVENWLLRALKENIPFISITGAFQHFQSRCKKADVTSEIALYSCLRQSQHPELVYPKLPFVYLKAGFTETIPVPLAFEDFIRDAGGPISYKEVRDFWTGKVFMKIPSFHELIQRASNVIRTSSWGYVHIDNAELDHESISHLIDHQLVVG